jgi:hypothetical protein
MKRRDLLKTAAMLPVILKPVAWACEQPAIMIVKGENDSGWRKGV